MHLMLMNSTLKYGYNGKFYVYFATVLKKLEVPLCYPPKNANKKIQITHNPLSREYHFFE